MPNPITDIIAKRGWCVADGATGSNFFGRGLEAGYPPDLWCVEKPEEVLWLHGAFLARDVGTGIDGCISRQGLLKRGKHWPWPLALRGSCLVHKF